MPIRINTLYHSIRRTVDGKSENRSYVSLNLIASPLDEKTSEPSTTVSPQDSSAVALNQTNEERAGINAEHDARRPHPGRLLFKHRSEANTTELFFDLSFVANLTIFSIDHEINDGNTLSSYVGFFTTLWFTWLQVTLFDARFSVDSIFERTCKALNFGVKTGFAVVGPNFMTNGDSQTAMRALNMILMVNRSLLAIQYATILAFARKYAEAIVPLVLKIVTLAISAIVFLGLYFYSNETSSTNGQIGWYLVSVFEAISLLTISSRWTSFSFRHTCLPHRVGLLTLIILGEGIIGFSRTLSKIEGHCLIQPC